MPTHEDSTAHHASTVTVLCDHRPVGEQVVTLLGDIETHLEHRPAPLDSAIRHARGEHAPTALVERLGALGLPTVEDDTLAPGELVVSIGVPEDRSAGQVVIRSDSPLLATELARLLAPWSRSTPRIRRLSPHSPDRIQFRAAPPLPLGLVQAAMAARGIALARHEVETWAPDDHDIFIDVRDPGGPSAGFSYPLQIHTDRPAEVALLVEDLERRGFRAVRVRHLHPSDDHERHETFRVEPGGLGLRPADLALGTLQAATETFLAAQGVDERWPLVLAHPEDDGHEMGGPFHPRSAPRRRWVPSDTLYPRLILPLGRFLRRELRPYGGAGPERFSVELRCDDDAVRARMAEAVTRAGFHLESATALLPTDSDVSVHVGSLSSEPHLLASLTTPLCELLVGEGESVELRVENDARLEWRVRIVAPLRLTAEERASRRRDRQRRTRVIVHGPARAGREEGERFLASLREAGFIRTGHQPWSDAFHRVIHYGGASTEVVSLVLELASAHFAVPFRSEQRWPEHDKDIHVFLPEVSELGERAAAPLSQPGASPFEAWELPSRVHADPPQPLIGWSPQGLRVGRALLPSRRRGDDGPELPAGLETYVVDSSTAATLEHLATSVSRREPVLLEGDTSTSKTSAILYLAAQLGRPVVRVNLSAMTDTSELIGRYLPATAGTATGTAWRWVDGRIVRALREGHWVVLDELNLAEPSVLERLNPLLEQDPSLVLTEHDGEVLGAGGTPIHPDFHVFATMNPAAYAGRQALSPALRDRFLGYLATRTPSEADLRLMLGRLVLGSGGELYAAGAAWASPGGTPVHPWLVAPHEQRRVPPTLDQLARLQVALTGMGGGDQQLGGPDQPPVYTRRSLLALVRAASQELAAGATLDGALRGALLRYVVGRATSPSQREAVARVLDACALGPRHWAPGMAGSPGGPTPGNWERQVDGQRSLFDSDRPETRPGR